MGSRLDEFGCKGNLSMPSPFLQFLLRLVTGGAGMGLALADLASSGLLLGVTMAALWLGELGSQLVSVEISYTV